MFGALLDKDAILAQVSQYQIMTYYLQVPICNGMFTSPFRKDNHPSCSFWLAPSGVLFIKDWTTGVVLDCFGAASKITKLKEAKLLQKIVEDLPDIKNAVDIELPEKMPLEYRVQLNHNFSDTELFWWGKYGITSDILLRNSVYSAKNISISNGITLRATVNNPIYIYSIPISNRFKWYRPKAVKAEKWGGTMTKYDILGYNALPKRGKVLIITSSLKDAMVIQSMGFPSIAPSSESTLLDKTFIKELKKRFKYIFVLMDDDYAGHASAIKYEVDYKLLNLTPYGFNKFGKDISDATFNKSTKKIKQWLQKIIRHKMKLT